ncbi:MAG TPA: hypothetical protein ENI17_07440 [Pseudomonas xinjiangensis]|uniref:Uncharacterized protein n=2 Tax=root TaxID=1 RepID=A0A7V1BQS5_9GAMM|nr:hypothetical protein [Halopseudomonas xinjiangensis]HEC47447.1 hypothetical protein [Halopseudomonas xinjiangensis]
MRCAHKEAITIKMRLAKYLLLLFFALLSNLGVAHASPQLLLGERNSRVSLDGQFEYFQDSGQLDIQAVQSLNDSDFLQSSEQVPNFGFTSSRYWFRTQLIREPAADSRWILELRYAPLDLIGVFLLDGNGDLLFEKHGGDSVPFADRPIKNRNFTVALPLPPDEPVWLYVSVQTEGSLQLPAVLFSSARFVAEARDEQYLQGLYYGVLLSMLLYNLLIFASIRDASHLYYIFYIAGFAIFQLTLNGLAFEYLWPELPAWNNRALPITIALSMAALLLLTQSFLQTRMTTPRLDPVLKIFFGLSCLTTILCLYAPYNLAIKVATASAVIVPLLVFVSGINSLAGGHRQARFFSAVIHDPAGRRDHVCPEDVPYYSKYCHHRIRAADRLGTADDPALLCAG